MVIATVQCVTFKKPTPQNYGVGFLHEIVESIPFTQ